MPRVGQRKCVISLSASSLDPSGHLGFARQHSKQLYGSLADNTTGAATPLIKIEAVNELTPWPPPKLRNLGGAALQAFNELKPSAYTICQEGEGA